MKWIAACLFASTLVASAASAQDQGTLVITGAPDGAEIFLDAEPLGRAPLAPLTLVPGRYTVRVTMPGFTEHNEVVTIAAGEQTAVMVGLFPVAMALELTTEPAGAQAFIDGRLAGETPLSIDLLAGQRSLRLVLPGYTERIERIDARAGTTASLRFELSLLDLPEEPETEWYESPWPFVGIGAGLVAVATVLIVVLVANDDPSRVDTFCDPGCVLVMPE